MKLTRFAAVACGVLLLFFAVFAVYVQRSAEVQLKPWSGYAYSSENNGSDPRLVDTFTDLDQCRNAAAKFLAANISLGSPANTAACKNNCMADLFLCGKSCSLPSNTHGTVVIADYQCFEKITLP